jgi:limonene-1,2-epoxide hydrolase
MNNDVIRAVDAYLHGLAQKDLSAAPFHPSVEFEGPLGPRIVGADSLRAILTSFFPSIKGVEVIRHIAQGEWCATEFIFKTTFGAIPMMDCFHVVDGQILSIRLYYDPRPMLAPTEK